MSVSKKFTSFWIYDPIGSTAYPFIKGDKKSTWFFVRNALYQLRYEASIKILQFAVLRAVCLYTGSSFSIFLYFRGDPLTDFEKVQILEKENLALKDKLTRVSEQMSRMNEALTQMREVTDAVADIKKRYTAALQELHGFKEGYKRACIEATKQTVRPYAKAVRQAKRLTKNK